MTPERLAHIRAHIATGRYPAVYAEELLAALDVMTALAEARGAEVAGLREAGTALAHAGHGLYAYAVRSHGSGAPGKPAFYDVLEAGLDAAHDFHEAQKVWAALAPRAAAAGEGES